MATLRQQPDAANHPTANKSQFLHCFCALLRNLQAFHDAIKMKNKI